MTLTNLLFRVGVGLSLCSGSVVLAQGPPAGKGPPAGNGPPVPATATVQVDCDNGDSINDALNTRAHELTIEISGAVCKENVVVQRSFVTLRGETDISGDPITAIEPAITDETPPSFGVTLLISDSFAVALENLIFRGESPSADEGIAAYGGGGHSIRGCISLGNDNLDLVLLYSTSVVVEDSRIGRAEILESSSLVMRGGELRGSALASGDARVALFGVDQTTAGTPPITTITGDSALFVDHLLGTPSHLGTVRIEDLSRAMLRSGTTVQNLTCEVGSDAFCDGTVFPISSDGCSCP